MDRKSFTQKLALLGVCPFVIQNLSGSASEDVPQDQDEKFKALQLITESPNQTIYIANVPEQPIRLFSKLPLENLSGLRLPKVFEEVARPVTSLCI
jgi:hypothetical protein